MVTRKDAEQIALNIAGIEQQELEQLQQCIYRFFDKRDLAKQVLSLQPIFYDYNKIWWLWNKKELRWKIVDEIEVLNLVNQLSNIDTISSTERIEILEAIKQEARLKNPKPIQKTWVQFKDEIIDIMTSKRFKPSPEYFTTNPIPYKLHFDNFENTPVMDRIFEEWVGKEHVRTLYEIIAYCLLPDYPIHRLFCFIGGGMNGKSCFLNLLKKFIGESNTTSTELDTLITSRFEVSRLHKKLVCIMGETNFKELSKTSILKKLTGGDFMGFEYKNKNPFEDYNYAKILIATNNLPESTDKSVGFYRRWSIIDFPNQFSEQKDILQDIPEEEYESLALKCCSILYVLLKTRKFTNEGSIEDRMKNYEDKSNPFDKFIKECCDLDDPDGFIWKFDFEKKFTEWCRENHFRQYSETSIGMKMKEKCITQIKKMSDWLIDGQKKQLRCWIGLKWKNSQGSQPRQLYLT